MGQFSCPGRPKILVPPRLVVPEMKTPSSEEFDKTCTITLQSAMLERHDGKTTVYALWTKCKPIGSPEKLWSKMASKETSKTTNKNCSMYKKSESNSPIFYYVLLKCYQKYAGNLRGTLSFPLCIFIQKICFGEKKATLHCVQS